MSDCSEFCGPWFCHLVIPSDFVIRHSGLRIPNRPNTATNSAMRRDSELRAGSGLLARASAVVQPDINAGRVPIIWLVQNVEVTVAVEISELAFMESVAGRQQR